MAKKADEKIVVPDDDPIEDQGTDVVLDDADDPDDAELAASPDPGTPEPDAAEEATKSLKAQLEAANKRAEEAERRAQEETRKHTEVRADLNVSHAQVIENAISATESERRELRSQLRAAKESGDLDTETDLLDKLGELHVKLQRLNEGKQALESQASQPVERAPQNDPIEAYVSGLDNASARQWIRAHPEVVTNPRMNAHLVAAHHDALADGNPVNSRAYFDYIEEAMGYTTAPRVIDPNPPTPRRAGAPAAPVARNGSDVPGMPRSGNTVTLTAKQREAARISGISDQEYARNLLAARRAGEIN